MIKINAAGEIEIDEKEYAGGALTFHVKAATLYAEENNDFKYKEIKLTDRCPAQTVSPNNSDPYKFRAIKTGVLTLTS